MRYHSLLSFAHGWARRETAVSRHHSAGLIGAGYAVTRDLGDSVTGHKRDAHAFLSHDGWTLSWVIYALRGRVRPL